MESGATPKKMSNKLDSILSGGESDENASDSTELQIDLDHAHQGEEAIALVEKAYKENSPYSIVFMDVRMPPGIDGIETIKQIRDNYKDQEFVICTAFNNYEWDELYELFGRNDRILYMSKPFDDTSLKQTANYILAKYEKENM